MDVKLLNQSFSKTIITCKLSYGLRPLPPAPLLLVFGCLPPGLFFSADMCAGSWMLVSRLLFLGRIINLETDSVILGAQNLSLDRPGASILAPWGTILAPWAIVGDHGSSRKDTSESGIG